MPAHALRKQFLPAVAVFRERRVGVLFFQRGRLESFLLVAFIDASGRSVEEALGPMLYRRLQHVCIDQNRQHAERFVRLNEAHPAHVGSQVVNSAAPSAARSQFSLRLKSIERFSTSSNC